MNYKIEKGIKPQLTRGRWVKYSYDNMPFKKMKKGESFAAFTGSLKQCKNMRYCLSRWLVAHNMDSFRVGQVTVGKKVEIRVWKS